MNSNTRLQYPPADEQHARITRLFGNKPDASNMSDRISRGKTPLDRVLLGLEETMAAADEAQTSSECGERVRHVMAMLADEMTSALKTIEDEIISALDDDEEAEDRESEAYRRQVQSDYRNAIGVW